MRLNPGIDCSPYEDVHEIDRWTVLAKEGTFYARSVTLSLRDEGDRQLSSDAPWTRLGDGFSLAQSRRRGVDACPDNRGGGHVGGTLSPSASHAAERCEAFTSRQLLLPAGQCRRLFAVAEAHDGTRAPELGAGRRDDRSERVL